MTALPVTGANWDALEREMSEARRGDVDWRRGRTAVYIHYAGEEVLDIAKRAYAMYFSENGLGPRAFQSLAKFENEVVGWTLGLLNGGPDAQGALTSGGTESIFLSVMAARDWARAQKRGGPKPRIVAAVTAHPAFNKAAHWLGMEVVRVPVGADLRPDLAAMAAAITPDTVMLVGSAPAYPYGMVDPIPQLGALAERHGLWLHVDACVGGYIAPFARKLGVAMPAFDFAVSGVTSISADLHKYGYTAKGASAVLFRDKATFAFLPYDFEDWPRGKYSTKTLVGTRPGGAIAAAWAVMRYLGEEGYLRITRRVLDMRARYQGGVAQLGFRVFAEPELSIFGYGHDSLDMGAVADRLGTRGWFVSRLTTPPGIHVMLNLTHEPVVEEYLADLAAARDEVASGAARAPVAAATY
jgi:glutamate/tyrosine decarboxylase-like PLP-dependent enzyme